MKSMKKEIRKYVGQMVKYYRTKEGLTQKQLGEKIGVKHNTISSYENGTNEAELNILYLLSQIFGITIDDFFPSPSEFNGYDYYPTSISAGTPTVAETVAEYDVQRLTIPGRLLGKWKDHKDLFFIKVNGESMNRVIPHDSIIAVKPIEISQLKNGDIVVYDHEGEYSVKRFYQQDGKIIFRPDSDDLVFTDQIFEINNELELKIKGKVVVYIVELD